MDYDVRFCTSADGTTIAYYVSAEDRQPPIISLFFWLLPTEMSAERALPLVRASDTVGAQVRSDRRGVGNSQHNVSDVSLERQVEDLHAVVVSLGVEQVDVRGSGDGAIIAAAYAGRHPERVRRLALSSFLRIHTPETWVAVAALIRANWSLGCRTLYDMRFGDVDREQRSWYIERMSLLISAEVAARYADAFAREDIPRELLGKIEAETIIVHSSRRRGASGDAARQIANAIPKARFVTTEYSEFEPGYPLVIRRFLDGVGVEAPPSRPVAGTGTVIIMFADIVDSTATTERIGDAAFRAQARMLDERLRATITEHAGTAIDGKLLGDGVLATFAAAKDAVAAALAFSSAAAEVGLQLHIGLHAGDVIREADNVYGGAVNIAARISALSAAGEVLVSDIVRGLARTSAGVTFEDRGEHALKGIAEPQRVYAVRPTGKP